MKYRRGLVLVGVVVLWVLLPRILPTEEEREKAKLKEIGNRNVLEKQLVGKWNHSDFPAGLENDRNYHLLSADAGYSYRGSDKAKIYRSGHWSINLRDSVLFIDRASVNNNLTYKIREIGQGYVRLQKIENDSLTRIIGWFRHP